MPRFKIVQLIPAAPGWWVEHLPEPESDDTQSKFGGVAFWALVEDTSDGTRHVVGVDPAWIALNESRRTLTGNGGMLIQIPDVPNGDGYAHIMNAESVHEQSRAW
ncbi:hypothetical protein [Pseudonocardia charpentierae]|uniref:Uncharacterized protein n=1 Tax=Pseudonocardia charpentierae TaxID=3075545 RepID=A0ABU2NJY6_9PSEU|nr:hypothetical protein [Pseudonocardia sp. DSM 45834]MDT0353743.1 hypothetical protein [Pseudonocardia sp. DSM 45834]